MAVQTYTGSQYLYTMTVTQDGDQTELSALGQFELDWSRELKYVKNLDDNAPYITYGKSDGNIVLQGKAITATVSTAMTTSNAIFQGENPNPTSPTVLTINCKSYKSGATASVSYSAFKTGKGFTYRKISDRNWILDGIQLYQFID